MRNFSTGRASYSVAAGESSAERSTEFLPRNTLMHSHRKAFVQWATSKGQQYKAAPQVKGNYLDGKSYPFPLNPHFQPRPPLPQKICEDVWNDWKMGTGLHQISLRNGIALERVEAILKLHQIRRRWTEQVSHVEIVCSSI